MTPTVVYALADRAGVVRYVGSTSRFGVRSKEHLRDGKADAWTRTLVLEVVADERERFEREAAWIAHGRAKGWPLTNRSACRGRPALPDGAALDEFLRVRLTEGEREQIERAASRSKERLSDWCRRALLAASA